jgi:hypothetical protein
VSVDDDLLPNEIHVAHSARSVSQADRLAGGWLRQMRRRQRIRRPRCPPATGSTFRRFLWLFGRSCAALINTTSLI